MTKIPKRLADLEVPGPEEVGVFWSATMRNGRAGTLAKEIGIPTRLIEQADGLAGEVGCDLEAAITTLRVDERLDGK